eukprot:SAG11_NODE_342_length_10454_cov_11.233079_3_plen_397_part_00
MSPTGRRWLCNDHGDHIIIIITGAERQAQAEAGTPCDFRIRLIQKVLADLTTVSDHSVMSEWSDSDSNPWSQVGSDFETDSDEPSQDTFMSFIYGGVQPVLGEHSDGVRLDDSGCQSDESEILNLAWWESSNVLSSSDNHGESTLESNDCEIDSEEPFQDSRGGLQPVLGELSDCREISAGVHVSTDNYYSSTLGTSIDRPDLFLNDFSPHVGDIVASQSDSSAATSAEHNVPSMLSLGGLIADGDTIANGLKPQELDVITHPPSASLVDRALDKQLDLQVHPERVHFAAESATKKGERKRYRCKRICPFCMDGKPPNSDIPQRNRRKIKGGRRKVKFGRYWRGLGYSGEQYCQRCSEIFRDHLIRQHSNSAGRHTRQWQWQAFTIEGIRIAHVRS